jgi:DNA-binding NarL/FixJ family response regulator
MTKKANSTVLIVDDDQRVLKSLKMWFYSEGFTPIAVSNGKAALDTVLGSHVEVAVVDFKIGKEDGIMVAQKLQEADEDLKIIILTGFPSYETAVQAMKIGAFDYLSKSSTNDKLISVVRKAIMEREMDRELKRRDRSGDKRLKMVLLCSHSLIKERLENLSLTSSEFKLIKSFSSVDTLGGKSMSQEVHIALVCAGCHLKWLKDAFSLFPDIYRTFPGVKVLIINSIFSDQEKVALLKLGVRGFLPQDCTSEQLEKALHHLADGELWVSRSVIQLSLKHMVAYDSKDTKKIKDSFSLTMREIEILRKMMQGLKNREIAGTLFISEATVKTHVNRIFKKMGVDNRSKAIMLALDNNLF